MCLSCRRSWPWLVRRQHRSGLSGIWSDRGELYSRLDRCVFVYLSLQRYPHLSSIGRMDPSVPRSKRLLTDDRSNIFVYMTGHGGNEFLKFQDNEEISAFDISDAFEQMWQKKRWASVSSSFYLSWHSSRPIRYNEIFFMIDTCQANTMYSKFYSPNILATGSSQLDENSYSVCTPKLALCFMQPTFWLARKRHGPWYLCHWSIHSLCLAFHGKCQQDQPGHYARPSMW